MRSHLSFQLRKITTVNPIRISDPFLSLHSDITEGCDWFFLDAFDTLLWRQCLWPTDIFKKLAKNNSIPRLAELHRKFSERISYWRSSNPTIENVFSGFYGWTIEEEHAAERAEILANPFFLHAVMRLRSEVRLVVLSDMYMSSAQIADLLEAAGYPLDTFHAIYSSADINASKHQGTAYKLVIRQLGARVERIAHYGDNPLADFHKPTSLGIKARLVHCPRTWGQERGWPLPKHLAWTQTQCEGQRLNQAFVHAVKDSL